MFPPTGSVDVSYVEGLIPSEFGASAVAIPGAREMLQAMDKAIAPWAIVTSGTRPLMMGWLDVLHLAHPQHVITAEDVKEGKPGECRRRKVVASLAISDLIHRS